MGLVFGISGFAAWGLAMGGLRLRDQSSGIREDGSHNGHLSNMY